MEIFAIETGLFKLDGGAMFGVVPKSIWQKTNPADENNLCTWAMRSLLVKSDKRLILIDCGCGNKQDERFFKHYYLHGEANLISSIRKLGFHESEITDVILTHLHFDHVGGATIWNESKTKAKAQFPNAKYWVNENQWNWALNPNPREKASFLIENFYPLLFDNQLFFLNKNDDFNEPNFDFFVANGHTEGMTIPLIKYKSQTIAFMADLLPSVGHFPLPYIMGYDVRPLESMKEKELFLQKAFKDNYVLFFQHDSQHECCNLTQTEKGIRSGEIFRVEDI